LSRTVVRLAAVGLLAGCGGDDAATTEAAQTSANGCTVVQAPEPQQPEPRKAPRAEPNAAARDAVVTTNCGTFTIRLDPKRSPNAVASFEALATDGYFEDTVFHRIVPGFVIQGGDPTATGTGGPGYTTVDPPPSGTAYTKNVVAMAKTAADPPGAAGSQFFVVTADRLGLPPDYAVIGEVTDGKDVVERIGRLGDPATEQPTQPVVVQSVTIR
jgi:peptidyl-prolyl cis-trans isomerase B (cyclophilin B)